jgi:hypothetical protein
MTPSGIELAAFWPEAQCLNPTRYHVPPYTSSCRKFTDRTYVHLKNRYYLPGVSHSRSQWPRGLRRGSAADLFLGLRVRIPLCCVLSRRGVCDGPIRCPEESYRVYVRARVSEYDPINPQWIRIKGAKNKKERKFLTHLTVFLRWHIHRNSAWNARLDSQRRQEYFFSQKNWDRSGAHPTSCSVDAGALTLGVNGLGNDSSNSPPSSADVKNVSTTYLSPNTPSVLVA